MYHQVSDESHPNFMEYTVTTRAFATQMKILKMLDFTPITFDDLINCKNGESSLPGRPIIITFDDGLKDALEKAVPILEDYSFKAVFYITVGYVGKPSTWMIPDVNVALDIADWSAIKELDAKGFEVGAHSVSHPHMDQIPADICYAEMFESRRVLEETLGHEVKHMAYPHGGFNETVRNLAYEAGYSTAATCIPVLATLDDDMLKLPRLNVGMEDTIMNFVSKLYIAQSPAEALETKLNVVRKMIPKTVKRFVKRHFYNNNSN